VRWNACVLERRRITTSVNFKIPAEARTRKKRSCGGSLPYARRTKDQEKGTELSGGKVEPSEIPSRRKFSADVRLKESFTYELGPKGTRGDGLKKRRKRGVSTKKGQIKKEGG